LTVRNLTDLPTDRYRFVLDSGDTVPDNVGVIEEHVPSTEVQGTSDDDHPDWVSEEVSNELPDECPQEHPFDE
jgi:hypothetical protein